ncbi:MAG TPA: C4-dicarboxylate ABC transporter substrate-binding protein [Lentisphaeria bacterium]|nr:MAG: C4-dicarboxylate ABC transporter substrate-binding protein [Lentisphaerae bacterium GWF2_49_21]HBC85664.1 C4-dicarboxylate ABC transporter substrate-binding protein [Lentisphaeria bacterium]
MKINLDKMFPGPRPKFKEILARNLIMSVGLLLMIILAISLAVFMFFNSAAPTTLTIAAGSEGSMFGRFADKYQKILLKQGIRLKILKSEGSIDNLKKLANPRIKVDVGFVQGGETEGIDIDKLVSLGTVSNQPIVIFYRGEPKSQLSEFKGQRLEIGQQGSGSYILALALLKANGIEAGKDATLANIASDDLVQALVENRVDAIFAMSDSVPIETLRKLMYAPGIRLFSFKQADAYTRRLKYLTKLEMPMGTVDLGKNIPSENVFLVGPSVELVARDNLHPALIDILLETAREVHGSASLFRKAGEFPALLEHEFRISPDAIRYYATGKSFLYRNFPFWLASLINRLLAAIVPIVLILIPAFKIVPVIWRWRWRSRIYRWYRVLFAIERDAFSPSMDDKKREELMHRLDHIEHTVDKIRVPAPFADQLYALRGHIKFVRERLFSEKK